MCNPPQEERPSPPGQTSRSPPASSAPCWPCCSCQHRPRNLQRHRPRLGRMGFPIKKPFLCKRQREELAPRRLPPTPPPRAPVQAFLSSMPRPLADGRWPMVAPGGGAGRYARPA
eukprot:5846721-Prymnesium_polylepis.1